MPLLFRIALRNLLEHRGKTLILGILIALGVVILIVGNSMMDTAREGIRRAFIDNYTGDIMVAGIADGPISLFGVQTVGGIDPTPVLPDFDAIARHVESRDDVAAWTTQITGFGFLRAEDERIDGIRNSVLTVLFAVDPDSYWRAFDNIEVVSGRTLRPGEVGLMLSTDRHRELERTTRAALADAGHSDDEVAIEVGDEVRIVGLTADGLPRIRVVPLVGIYDIKGINEGVGFELVSYLDPQTLRAIQRLNLGASAGVTLDIADTELLDRDFSAGAFDVDDLFGDSLLADDGFADDLFAQIDFDDIDAILRRDRTQPVAEGSAGEATIQGRTWNYMLIRVRNPRRTDAIVDELNGYFASSGIAARAGNWEAAAGPFATTADVIRTVFNVAISIIGIVALIIMTNTLVISVLERTSEIGTMRALGAQRGFVWRMFAWETLTITTVFGILGAVVALGIIGALNLIGVPATNTFLTILFAGPELKPIASGSSIVSALVVVSAVGLIAHLYPVAVALRIAPIRAIQSE
ncbi:MAG: ABC transporter permease [Spirochaetaceae bacterium]|nr:MAG: ABC transporter permease [Spirochaetaceae bacterium]